MYVIECDSVNDALAKGLRLIGAYGVEIPSRNGPTIEVDAPVTTVYNKPWNKVLISKTRDANPFFHLMESLWILYGREDVKFLTEFNKRMGDYSDDGLVFNAPYGHRLRDSFGIDQIRSIIDILKEDPNSRQAVGQIWDVSDLRKGTKDKACNMQTVFRIRNGKLDLTVYNRSNDVIWGAYGANAVQFSTLLEYVAAKVGVPMGTYTQVSNSYHVYTDGPGGEVYNRLINNQESIAHTVVYDQPNSTQILMTSGDMELFDRDLNSFFYVYDSYGLAELGECTHWQSDYFKCLVMPMLCTFLIHKANGPEHALQYVNAIKSDDWRMACRHWLENRVK